MHLYKDYSHFLTENKMYDPSLLPIATKKDTIFIAPELFPFPLPSSQPLVSLDELKCSKTEHRHFHSAEDEVISVCHDIRELLSTCSATDIIITLAPSQPFSSLLFSYARRFDLPLEAHQPESLLHTKGSGIFALLSDFIQEDGDYRACERLFLDPSIPWKRRDIKRKIVRWGLHGHCISGSNRWFTVLRLDSPERKDLQSFWNSTQMITRSQSFTTLRRALESLFSDHIERDNSHWDPKAFTSFQRARGLLARLIVYEKRFSFSTPSPWAFFRMLLSHSLSSPLPSSGSIAVYEYPHSALFCAKYHFVMNMNQQDICISNRLDSILGIHRNLIHRPEPPPPSLFFKAYSVSDQTIFSASDVCRTEKRFPLLKQGSITPSPANPLIEDQLWWQTKQNTPPSLSLFLYKSMMHYRTRSQGLSSRINYRSQHLAVQNHLSSVSSTDLDYYHASPFAFWLSKISEEDELPPATEVLLKKSGQVYHRIISEALKNFDMSSLAQGSANKILSETIKEKLSKNRVTLLPYSLSVDLLLDKMYATLLSFLSSFAKHYASSKVWKLEENYRIELSSLAVVGKIDLLLVREGKLVLIDFKRSFIPSSLSLQKNIIEELPSLQMPLYTLLVSSTEKEDMVEVSYASISKKSYSSYFPTHKKDKGILTEEMIDELHSQYEALVSRLHRGDFRCPVGGCTNCPIMAICFQP